MVQVIKADDRFYVDRKLLCPLCHVTLEAKNRTREPQFMKLVHPISACDRSGREYYFPGESLGQIPEEFQ